MYLNPQDMIRKAILTITLILFLSKQNDAQIDQKFFNFHDTSFEVGSVLRTRAVLFDYDQATFRDTSYAFLDSLKMFLIKYPGLSMKIGVHRDTRGSDMYSISLTQKRAEAIVKYLINEGLNSKRIVARGYEESQPIHPEEYIKQQSLEVQEELHAKNRRVEITIMRTDFE